MPPVFAVPVRSLFVLTLAVAVMVAMSVWLWQPLPWLGANFVPAPSGDGVVVTQVHPDGPADGYLVEGDLINALLAARTGRIDLSGYRPDLEPHGLPTFAALREYLARQGQVFEALVGEEVILVTTRGEIAVRPGRGRPLASLPAAFWLFHAFGGIALLVGGAVWLSRRERTDATLLAVSGLGFFLATWFNSIYLVRELAFPAGLFDLLLRGNHLALTVMIGAILLLFVHYPRAAMVRWPHALVIVMLFVYQANENLQWIDWPLHSFYVPLVVLYGVAVGLAYRQWRLSRDVPADRASLKWVFLAILMTMGTCMVIYFLPPILGREALLPQVAMVGFAVLMYLGLALGVIRYRLFQLERWWFEIWFWFLAGLMLILVDLGLVLLIQLEQFQALGLALILVGWMYFPVRQLVWRRLMRRRQDNLVELLPGLVDVMLHAPNREEMENRWGVLLNRAFGPLEITRETGDREHSELGGHGETMRVPGLFGDEWVLTHAQKGGRLFTPDDIREADSLRLVARQVCDVRFAREEGAVAERQRIVRDLHDDVGNRLLSLVRFSETPRQELLARSTLKALRESMCALDPGRECDLDQVFADVREQVREWFSDRKVNVHWDLPVWNSPPAMQPRQAINLRRILDEALGNAMTHADPTYIYVSCRFHDGHLVLTIENDGVHVERIPEDEDLRGRGMKNMQIRATEIGGDIGFVQEGKRYRVTLDWVL